MGVCSLHPVHQGERRVPPSGAFCDDFSISSREMYSLSKDDYMCLHSISDDHTKFWEESMGLQSTRITEECSGIPIEIDLSSSSSVCSSMSDLTI